MPSKKKLDREKIAERESRRFSKQSKYKTTSFKSKGNKDRYYEED